MKVICDAAVLIRLAKIGKLDFLEKLYEKIYISLGFYNEVVVRGRSRPGAEEIDQAKWLEKTKVKDRTAVPYYASLLRPYYSGLESG